MLFSDQLGNDFARNAPLPAADFKQYARILDGKVAPDYLAFMQAHNGGEGPVGKAAYLAVYGLEEMMACNRDWHDPEEVSGFTIFASNGGNGLYAFHGPGAVVEFDRIGLTPAEALYIAEDFMGFIDALFASDDD